MGKNDNENESDQQGFAGGSRWGGFGHQGFARQNFGQRGWLRPAVLKLLEKKPLNGMEIINEFNEASHGWWRPSPGSVYPLLESLETEGMIKKKADGRYTVTNKFADKGSRSSQLEEMMANMEGTVMYFEELSRSDKAKFSAYKKRIEKLAERLSDIK